MNKQSFILLQLTLGILLVIAMIGSTYSWADRPSQLGNEIALKYSTAINGNSATGVTYSGTYNEQTGEIDYSSASFSPNTVNVVEGEKWYFRTVVKNSSASAANVSLYAKRISYSAALEGKFYIGVTTPVNSHRTYEETATNTVEWAPIVSQYEVGRGATTVIEWYIEFNAAGSFTIDGLYLVNS
jgi:hypothetical protein